MDPDGRAAIDLGVAETHVIDQPGVVMAKVLGAVGSETLDQVLGRVLAGQSVATSNDEYRTGPGIAGESARRNRHEGYGVHVCDTHLAPSPTTWPPRPVCTPALMVCPHRAPVDP